METAHAPSESSDHHVWTELVRIGLVAVAAAAVWLRVWEPFSRVSVIGVVGTVGGGAVPALELAWFMG